MNAHQEEVVAKVRHLRERINSGRLCTGALMSYERQISQLLSYLSFASLAVLAELEMADYHAAVASGLI